MKIIITIILFIAFLHPVYSQGDNEIDSLQTLLESSTDLNTQITVYTLLSTKHHTIDLKKAKNYANQALVLSQNTAIGSCLGDIYRSLGDIAIKQDSLELAKDYFEHAYDQFKKQSSPIKLADIIIVLGNVEFVSDQLANAMDYYLKAIEISHENNFNRRLIRIYLNIGAINNNLQNYPKAIENLSKSLEICIVQKDSFELPKIYLNMGIAYHSLNDISLAQSYFKKSLMLYQKLDHSEGIARSFINLAGIEQKKGKLKNSFELIDDALDQIKRPNKYYSAPVSTLLTNCYLIRGENYLLLNDINNAHNNLQKAFKLSSEINQFYVITMASYKLSNIWKHKGNSDSALYYFEIYNSYSDSLSNNENIKKLAYLESKYEFEQKINQEKEVRIYEVSHEKRKYLIFLYISSGLLFALILMILLLYLLRKKARQSQLKQTALKRELEERNKELTTHVMYQLKKNEFILSISKKLQSEIRNFKPTDRGIIEKIINDLERDSNKSAWEEFEIRFHRVHSGFNKKLLDQFPDLSTNDLRLCAFIRLNMNTKEISSITYQSTSSIDTARFRLKQKMGLGREDSLIAFLNRF